MTISQKDYEKFKEMYDHKRLVEYNKEKIKKNISDMYEEFPLAGASQEEVFQHFWEKVDLNNVKFDEPPENWIPKAQALRKWNE